MVFVFFLNFNVDRFFEKTLKINESGFEVLVIIITFADP
jgi:hypothetical protein